MGLGRIVRQVVVAVAVAAFVVACLRLGWWQWQRYHAPGGSLQNLGYTLQWPTFALFAIFMVWRLRRLERQRAEQPPEQPLEDNQPSAPTPAQPRSATRAARPADPTAGPATATPATPAVGPATPTAPPAERATPDEADDELAAYNRYLAQLNARHEEQHRGR